jgi:Fic family protein
VAIRADFQPLLPGERALGPLLERAAILTRDAHRLGALAGPLSRPLQPLLRAMNSYYTNRIEGQHTRPVDIERALARQFDASHAQARKQRLAVAHIEAEAELEQAIAGAGAVQLYAASFVSDIHAAVYRRLPARDRKSDTGDPIEPGATRSVRVTAGRHVAPDSREVPRLLVDWGERYANLKGTELSIVGGLCAHHRLLWIHPFLDGNGRVARLHTHLVLHSLELTYGLWSPLRGVARDVETYYARLNNADLPRRNELDGRGPLSEEELVAFAGWLLDVCIDQVRFMTDLLALVALRDRIADLLGYLAAHPWRIGSATSVVRTEAVEALHYVAVTGPLERSRFMAMTGLPSRTARRVLSALLDYGVLTAASPRAKVAFAAPLRSLRFLFPRLWPEAESDV